MAARTVAFLNFKGGVGKTAGAVNVGACLARYLEKRVLIVDLDPQCNSSFWLCPQLECRHHTQNGKNSTCQIFMDHVQGTHLFDFDSAVLTGVPRIQGYPGIAALDILPADISLIKVEDWIHGNRFATQFFRFLYKSLSPYFERYDYVLLDCPPNVYSVSKNALFAADCCIVPYMPDFLSLTGFQILAEQVNDFNNRVSGYRQGRSPCEIVGLMINHFRKGTNHATSAIEELRNIMAHLRAEGLIHQSCELLEPYVRTCAAVAASTEVSQPVCLSAENSMGCEDFYNLALNMDALLRKIK